MVASITFSLSTKLLEKAHDRIGGKDQKELINLWCSLKLAKEVNHYFKSGMPEIVSN